MSRMATGRSRGKVSRLGLLLTLAIILAVIAFGVFKRKGARKPPPIPEDATGSRQSAPPAFRDDMAHFRV